MSLSGNGLFDRTVKVATPTLPPIRQVNFSALGFRPWSFADHHCCLSLPIRPAHGFA